MSREIKFKRAFFEDKEMTKLHACPEWGILDHGTHYVSPQFYGDAPYFKDFQYTGLRDQDNTGKKLYDNDLIINASRNDNKPHQIRWSERYAAWVGFYGIEYFISEELAEIEKVGTTYENPELLTA